MIAKGMLMVVQGANLEKAINAIDMDVTQRTLALSNRSCWVVRQLRVESRM
jgi:hypothetical protein